MRVTAKGMFGGVALAAAALPAPAWAATAKIDGADTAWMLVATGLVLMMTIPALALLYCSTGRRKNVLSTMGQNFVAVAMVSILWAAFGYNGTNSISPFATTIPEILFIAYQMTFAVITLRWPCGNSRYWRDTRLTTSYRDASSPSRSRQSRSLYELTPRPSRV